ncbi:hypothetical protein [Pseudoalteromonas gelatinilytica]|uniref:Cthe-2314-like HEPN domain-containing protein n=1 Tax=Pseudoalteromonas gelatinilytica TaxID=1703256 RepID=A0A3A3EP79_9GAMM|nr:hypothetical protein [Pseudoalteromonas profundi]RJF37543.1 hypothetical protein D4741_05580 [Pseudoalteromonas profundi]|tara:strand:- start:13870 stop:14457 length:588 start_codon:yes stop_codon:yes gene_type:complete
MKVKTFYSCNTAHGLIGSSKYLLGHIEDDELFRNNNKYSFILVSAATLESLLNDGIISWAFHTFKSDDYKRHAQAFLSMNLVKKLDALGFLLSSGVYVTDNTSATYQTLSNLVKLRNEVAHSKDFYSETEMEYGAVNEDGMQEIKFPQDMIAKMSKSPLNISNEDCLGIVYCLEHLQQVLKNEVDYSDTELFKIL